jgi:sporulation protein YlmC with PRC-barrel domain
MRNTNLIFRVMAGGMVMGATYPGAQSAGAPYNAYRESGQARPLSTEREQPSASSLNLKASSIIGMPVRNDAGERLGKVQDLVVNLGSDMVPFAIIEYGGALGVAETRVAVPLNDLRCSNQDRELRLAATKEQLDAAISTPTGRWLAVAGQDWLRGVDRFYGQPQIAGQARFERQESEMNGGREPVRTPADQTGSSMQYPNTGPSGQSISTMTKPADDQLAAQVNALVQQNVQNGARNVQVVIRNGVVTLRGRIPTVEQRDLLEKQIKALPGVDRVQDSMITGPE